MASLKQTFYSEMLFPATKKFQFSFDVTSDLKKHKLETIIAPRIESKQLVYLSVSRFSQSLCIIDQRMKRKHIRISNMFDKSLKDYLTSFLLSSPGWRIKDSPEVADRFVAEHLFPQLYWEKNDRYLVIGCPVIGWFLYERNTAGEYQYSGSFCGTIDKKTDAVHSHPDSMILFDFYCENVVLMNDEKTALLVGRRGKRENDNWYIYPVRLRDRWIKAFYPVGRAFSLKYLRKRNEFLIFRSTNSEFNTSTAESRKWEMYVELADCNGQTIKTMNLSPPDDHYSLFEPVFFQTHLSEEENMVVWCENRLRPSGILSSLNLQEELADCFLFEATSCFYDAASGSVFLVRLLSAEDEVGIYQADIKMTDPIPLFHLNGNFARENVSVVGTLADKVICQINGVLFAIDNRLGEPLLKR